MSGAAATDHVEALIATEEQSDSFSEGGAFLPLGVWTAQGYDADAIANLSLPEDCRSHPVLGNTYRVRIVTKTITGVRKVARTSTLKRRGVAMGDGEQSNQSSRPAPATPLPITDADPADMTPAGTTMPHAATAVPHASPEADATSTSTSSKSSSSSSNSSDSSDGNGKKHKKSKKNKRKSKKSKKKKHGRGKSKKAAKREPEDTKFDLPHPHC